MDAPKQPAVPRHRLVLLGVSLMFAMFIGTFPQYSLGVIAPLLVDETGVTDFQIGIVASMLYLTAAVVAWFGGRFIDAASSRVTLAILYGTSTVTLLLYAASQSLVWLLIAVTIGGISIGANNPATNRAIATHVPEGNRALVISIKQIGVKVAQVSAGVLIPLFALTLGWRPGLTLFAGSMLAISLTLLLVVPREETGPAGGSRRLEPDPQVKQQVRWLRIYAASLAVGMSALTTYLPLYAVRDLGLPLSTAGFIVTAMGGFAVATRLVWAVVSEKTGKPTVIMFILAAGGGASLTLIAAASVVGPWALWVGAISAGATVGSWNVVAHLSIVNDIEKGRSATATGYMQATFLVGLSVGAPLFGAVVEFTDSYPIAWLASALLSIIAFHAAWSERRRRRLAKAQQAAQSST